MSVTLDHDTGISSAAMAPGGLIDDIAGILEQQGFTPHRSDDETGGRLTITNAPDGICDIDIYHNGYINCEYFPRTGVQADPAHISRAVLRLLAATQDGDPAGGHLDTHPEITLKSAVGCAMRARGLMVELSISEDPTNFSVYAEIEITNPEQPDRGTVSITDDGCIWWECDMDELAGQEREIAMALASMLAPPMRRQPGSATTGS